MCKRCDWGTKNELMIQYHDEEWGVPLHNDNALFEFLVLEGFQAGLSWQTILNKRADFRLAFDCFDPETVALYQQDKLDELVQNKAIIRNKLKIASAVNNAQRFLEVQKEFGSFDKYIWGFVDYQAVQNEFESMKEIPATTPLSDKLAADLKKRGFKFVGSTIVYAFMQATGMVNDHLTSCWRFKEVQTGNKT